MIICLTKEDSYYDEKTEAAKLLEMKMNKNLLLQQHLTSSTGKVITLKV